MVKFDCIYKKNATIITVPKLLFLNFSIAHKGLYQNCSYVFQLPTKRGNVPCYTVIMQININLVFGSFQQYVKHRHYRQILFIYMKTNGQQLPLPYYLFPPYFFLSMFIIVSWNILGFLCAFLQEISNVLLLLSILFHIMHMYNSQEVISL